MIQGWQVEFWLLRDQCLSAKGWMSMDDYATKTMDIMKFRLPDAFIDL